MFAEYPFLYHIFWATIGMLTYRLVHTIYDQGKASLFAKEIILRSLVLVGNTVEDIAFMREVKYKTLSESDTPKNQIALIKELDEQALSRWKKSVIQNFIATYPGSLRNLVEFNTWDEAMQKLDQLHKCPKGKNVREE
tara:strand:- start:262 stop:675 length:414 start_codon:yes stop_codon:yes gene_type:complete